MKQSLTKTVLPNKSETSSTSNKKKSSTRKTKVINIQTVSRNEVKTALRKKNDEESNTMPASFARNEPPIPEAPIPPNDTRFRKGVSGNPAGRPLGSRNQSTLLGEQLIENAGEDIARVLLELALNANVPALRLVTPRALPIKKGGYIKLDINPTDSPNEIIQKVINALCAGEITSAEAVNIATVMTVQAKIDMNAIVLRVKQLESHLGLVQSFEEQSNQVIHEVPA
jgi:Family of unknown function (DUF5681)